MTTIAIDIGTTKICVLTIDDESGEILDCVYADNAFMPSQEQRKGKGQEQGKPKEWERGQLQEQGQVRGQGQEQVQGADGHNKGPDINAFMQEPGEIFRVVDEMCSDLIMKHPTVSCIGITGQMHGILYVDADGAAISPLYTWQDRHGDLMYSDGQTYAEYLSGFSMKPVSTGYGIVTHFYMLTNSIVPTGAARICTIGDYVAMRLTNRREPFMHATNSASLGFTDSSGRFDESALTAAGIRAEILPAVTVDADVVGKTTGGIPVSVAIGDNQAGFLGSIAEPDKSILVNIGTGSQVSFVSDQPSYAGMEARPYFGGKTLHVGAGLCGGRAYAVLEKFFRHAFSIVGGAEIVSAYPYMAQYLDDTNAVFETGVGVLPAPLNVSTKFTGTRSNPAERGCIANISLENFTPGHLVLGFLTGIVMELYELMPNDFKNDASITSQNSFISYDKLVAAGNGIRKNPALARILSETFNMPVAIPKNQEEAAYGAALFAMAATGRFQSLSESRKLIRYT